MAVICFQQSGYQAAEAPLFPDELLSAVLGTLTEPAESRDQ